MKKILFFIHDLGQGGAEKVLVNLVNNIDRNKFDVSVIALFGSGVNEQFLKPDIYYKAIWPKMLPGNSQLMKLLTPKQLHHICVKEKYDIEISYLEGPSARIISGCTDKTTKLVSWIHVEQHTMRKLSASFRSSKEACRCYHRFDQTVCVSENVYDDFRRILDFQKPCQVLHNTVESEKILRDATEPVLDMRNDDVVRLIAIGTLKKSKGYMRLLRIIKRLKDEKYKIHLYVLGIGPLKNEMQEYIQDNEFEDTVTLLGYKINPYKYIKNCDLFVCASFVEGFSTAVTESLIVGTPVCTVDVSGMKELLGENNEYGVITENNEEALFQEIKRLLSDDKLLAYYREKAKIRGNIFETHNTVKAVENFLMNL